jgi:hypothetical protein
VIQAEPGPFGLGANRALIATQLCARDREMQAEKANSVVRSQLCGLCRWLVMLRRYSAWRNRNAAAAGWQEESARQVFV